VASSHVVFCMLSERLLASQKFDVSYFVFIDLYWTKFNFLDDVLKAS